MLRLWLGCGYKSRCEVALFHTFILRTISLIASHTRPGCQEMASTNFVFGPMFIGVFVDMILYGIMLAQMLVYYQTYKKDAIWTRYLVLYLLLIGTINTGCNIVIMYEPLVSQNGSTAVITLFPTLLLREPITAVVTATPVQFFMAWRIMKITGSWWILGIIAVAAVASCAGGVWRTVAIASLRQVAKQPRFQSLRSLWLTASTMANLLIAVSLTRTLYIQKVKFTPAEMMMARVITIVVPTGVGITISSLYDLVLFYALPDTMVNFLWNFVLCKLYINTAMSILNGRVRSKSLGQDGALINYYRRSRATSITFERSVCDSEYPTSFKVHPRDMEDDISV